MILCLWLLLLWRPSGVQAQSEVEAPGDQAQPEIDPSEDQASSRFMPRDPHLFDIIPAWTEKRCVRAVLENGPEVAQQTLAVDKALAQLHEARAAKYPTVGFQMQVVHQTSLIDDLDLDMSGLLGNIFGTYPVPTLPTLELGTQLEEELDIGSLLPDPNLPLPSPNSSLSNIEVFPEDIMTLGFKLQQPLYTSGKIDTGIALAGMNLVLQTHQLEAKGYEAAYQVRRLYLALLMSQASIRLLDEMHRRFFRIVEDTKHLFKEGFVTRGAVLEAEGNLMRIAAQRARTFADQVQAQEVLRMLVGAEPEDPMRMEGSLETLPVPRLSPVERLVAEALERRPELEARRVQAQLAKRQLKLKAADGNLKPVAALSLEGGLRGLKYPLIEANWMRDWDPYLQAVVMVQFGLFDGKGAESRLKQADIERQQAQLGVVQNEALVRAEVRKEHARAMAMGTGLKAAEAEEAARSERLRTAEVEYAEGELGRAEYIQVQLSAVEARAKTLSARYALQGALLDLDHVTGRLPRTVTELAP